MDNLDFILEKVDRLGIAERVLIKILLVSGVMTLAVLTPGLFSSFGPIKYKNKPPKRDNIYYGLLPRLVQKGIIEFCESGDKKSVRLTKYGKQLGQAFGLDIVMTIQQRDKKAGICTLISFDVPETQRVKRDLFRNFLKKIGCVYLHQSVWLFEGDIRDELAIVAGRLRMEESIFACISKTNTFLSHGRGLKK